MNKEKEAAALETLIAYHTRNLNQAIDKNVEFRKTKVIFHEIKKLRDRLDEIRNLSGVNLTT